MAFTARDEKVERPIVVPLGVEEWLNLHNEVDE